MITTEQITKELGESNTFGSPSDIKRAWTASVSWWVSSEARLQSTFLQLPSCLAFSCLFTLVSSAGVSTCSKSASLQSANVLGHKVSLTTMSSTPWMTILRRWWLMYVSFMPACLVIALIFCQQHRQIGNAVPVPLALALGKALGRALIKKWKKDGEKEGSPEV